MKIVSLSTSLGGTVRGRTPTKTQQLKQDSKFYDAARAGRLNELKKFIEEQHEGSELTK